MSIIGKIGEEMRAEGYTTVAEAVRKFSAYNLAAETLNGWVARGYIDAVKIGRFNWVKIEDVQKRCDLLEEGRKRTAGLPAHRWPKPNTPDAPPPKVEPASGERIQVFTREDLKDIAKEAMREVLREFGLVS